jgi:hypothetical protein
MSRFMILNDEIIESEKMLANWFLEDDQELQDKLRLQAQENGQENNAGNTARQAAE